MWWRGRGEGRGHRALDERRAGITAALPRSHRAAGAWTVFDRRYWPGDALADLLEVLLKHEDVDLPVLRRIFNPLPQTDMRDTQPSDRRS